MNKFFPMQPLFIVMLKIFLGVYVFKGIVHPNLLTEALRDIF